MEIRMSACGPRFLSVSFTGPRLACAASLRTPRSSPNLKQRHGVSAAGQVSQQPLLDLTVLAPAASLIASIDSSSLEATKIATIALPAVVFAGILIWRFVLYGQLEYITAAMLARYVPTDGKGAVVLQLGGGTKELYYYPKNTLAVTVVGERINAGLIDQGGASAGVPASAKVQSPASLAFQADRSVDAVVSLGALGTIPPEKLGYSLGEYLRVLKPGCPLIFIECLKDASASPLRPLLGGQGASVDTALLERLKSFQGWELVQWDLALEGTNPHAVGVALKADLLQQQQQQRGRGSSKVQPAPGKGR